MYMRIINFLDFCLRRALPHICLRYYRKEVLNRVRETPSLFEPVSQEMELKHKELWSRLGLGCATHWFRLFSRLSGIIDYRYVPNDLYQTLIERVLNDYARRNLECEDKNSLDIYIDKAYTPEVVLRYIRGMFMDEDYNVLSMTEVDELLEKNQGDLIGKIAVGSLGGHGVEMYNYDDQSHRYCKKDGSPLTRDDISSLGSYILEKRIIQCDFTAQFNPSSCNTFRMITLRCPWDGQIVLLKTGFRVGVSALPVDNLSSGGICVPVDENGRLGECAFSYMAMTQYARYTEHPVTHICFKGKLHPMFEQMRQAVLSQHKRIPYNNILAWDVVSTNDGSIKILEVNAVTISIDWVQYGFGPLFGEYTEKIVNWCVSHRSLAEIRLVSNG